ncbi:MAG: transposase [Candidatus Omnitrophica bacterium]|nr:transposase [Candidatus Omnitrophota bacterium]
MLVDERPVYYKNRLIQIFRDHWEQFKHFYPHLVNEDIEANVQKMIGCGLFSNGYAEYRCRCGYIKRVAFSCKSRFCLRCSKVYVDNWVAKMKQTIFAKIEHRHIILTVPGSLWRYFHTKDILKLLADCGAKLIEEVVSVCLKGKRIELGIMSVTQTAGRKSTWNPHLHLLVTEGGLDKNNRFHKFYYFDYKILRKKWMYILLAALKKALSYDPEAIKLIDEAFRRRNSTGLIARAKKEKVRKADIIGYLIKYVTSPPIALYRITDYDGKYVRYWYREHPTDRKVFTKVSVYEFIATLIQHIPPKGLKLIRHYGLYARSKFNKTKEIIDKIFKRVRSASQQFLSFLSTPSHTNYRERLINFFGIDPLKCPNCGEQLILYEIWHPKHGVVYDIFRDENWRDYVVEEEKPEGQRPIRENNQLFLLEMQPAD